MAGDWIKMRECIHEDPAVLMIAERLGTRAEHVVGYCHRFWSWVSRNCHDGSVTGVTLESLECVLNLPGFAQLLCDVGWLKYTQKDGEKPRITIPHFDRHLSEGAKKRCLNAERQRKNRVTKPSRKQRDKSVTREEKRREDNKYPLPPSLNDARISELWPEFVKHRKEKRSPLTPTAAQRAIKKLESLGIERAIAALEHSVSNGYTGIYEPGESRGGSAGKPKRGPELDPVKANATYNAGGH